MKATLKKVLAGSSSLLVAASWVEVEDPLRVQTQGQVLDTVKEAYPAFDQLVFRPKATLTNGHTVSWMTGIKTRFNRTVRNRLKFQRRVFTLSDGAEIALDSNIGGGQNRPLLVIIPGLMSSCFDHYHHTLIDEAVSNGYDWTLINYRGVTHPMSTGLPFTYHDVTSFQEPLSFILDQNPNREIFVVGSSLGGNIAANIMASDPEQFDSGRIKALVLSQPALDLEVANQNLRNSLGGFYDTMFAAGFKEYMTKSNSMDIMRSYFNSKPS